MAHGLTQAIEVDKARVNNEHTCAGTGVEIGASRTGDTEVVVEAIARVASLAGRRTSASGAGSWAS